MIRESDEKQMTLPGFETPFERNLDLNNRWVKLAEVVPWRDFAQAYNSRMSAGQGRPSKPARLVVGAVIVKHRQKWTDEETVPQIQENPYLQLFCGFSEFTLDKPFAPSLFVEIRKRMGADVFARFEQSVQERLEGLQTESKKKNKGTSSKDDDDKPSSQAGGSTDLPANADDTARGNPNRRAS